MRGHMVTAVAALVVVMLFVGSAVGQESSATIRTYQGLSYKVTDPSLEVFFTIGEPKEKKEEAKLPTSISISTSASATGGGGEQPVAGEQEARVLRGHSRASEITVSRQGVETRIALDQIRSLQFARKPVTASGLQPPPYVPYYRYSVSVSLVSGEKLEADYVNLGGVIVRGTAPSGRVGMPWEEVESIVFER